MTQHSLNSIARALRRRRPLLAFGGLLAPLGALATPGGADVVHGQVGISTPGAGGLVIDQTSNSAIINWQEFSIGAGEYVLFNQPSASAAVLNRVIGGLPSEILGDLTANGRVFLINPQGVLFGAGSRVDVGALVATTHALSDQDFLAGNYVFAGTGSAGVVNAGDIRVGEGGFVVLTADHVRNSGTITAAGGDVVLAAGSQVSMQLDADGLVSVGVDAAALSDLAGVDNAGEILADGGAVLLRADVARALLASAVNNSGRISAQAIEQRGGEIYLVASGGDIVNSGTLDASGGDGGRVALSGDRDVILGSGAVVDASGSNGTVLAIAGGTLDHQAGAHVDVGGSGGSVELSGRERVRIAGSVDLGSNGHLLIDPTTFTIADSGGDMDTATLETLLQSNDRSSTVRIVATDAITIQNLGGDNTINGVNTNDATKGAGLKLETGSCGATGTFGECIGAVTRSTNGSVFINGSDDTLDIASDIEILGGSSGGLVDVNARLVSGGDVYIEGHDGVEVSNTIDADGDVAIYAYGYGGTIATRGIGGQYVTLYSGGGAVIVGDANTAADIDAGEQVYVYAGNGGIALHGQTTAGGSVTLDSSNGIFAQGNIAAVDSASLSTDGGSIGVQGVTVTGRAATDGVYDADISIANYGSGTSDISTGALSATASHGRASVYVYNGNGAIHVGGDIVASGGGFTDPGYGGDFQNYSYGGDLAAEVGLEAYNGAVDVDGDVDITALAIDSTTSYLGDTYSSSYGEAALYAYGASVNFDGAVTVKGVGGAYVDAYTGVIAGGGITFGSTLTVIADAATDTSDYADGSRVERRYGEAEAYLTAYSGTITTHGVDISGPNAYFDADADRVVLNGDEDSLALSLTAPQGDNSYEYRDADDELQVSSSYGVALAQIFASGGDSQIPSVFADGDIDVSGPTAGLFVTAAYGVGVDGNVAVAGLGYLIEGDWNLLPFQHRPGGYAYGDALSLQSGSGGDPLLDNGSSAWGSGVLQIAGIDTQYGGPLAAIGPTQLGGLTPAGDVLIGGNLDVSGQGRALANIAATSLSIGGDVTVHADAGFVAGTVQSYAYIDDQYYDVVRQIGGSIAIDGNTGAPIATGSAQFGEARFLFDSAGANTSFDIAGELVVSGNSAAIEIVHAGDAQLGGIQLLGGRGGDAPRYAEVATYTPDGEVVVAAIDPYVTEVVGDANVLDIGIDTAGPASLSVDGNVVVEGTGVVAAVLNGGTVDIGGTVTLQHEAGSYSSNDPAYAVPPPDLAAAALFIDAGQGSATIGGINAQVDGTLAVGLDVLASGNVVLQADVLTQTLSGAYRDFAHPASVAYPQTGSPDVAFAPLSIQANGITLSFSADSELLNAALAADGTLTINGGGATLNAGSVDWSGNAKISNATIAASQFTLAGGGTLSNATLDAGSGSMDFSGGAWTVGSGSTLIGGAIDFSGISSLTVQNATIDASTFSAIASGQLQIIGSTLDGSSGILQTTGASGAGILVDHSTLGFGTTTIDSASLFELRANTIDAADLDVTTVDLTLVADTDLTIVNRTLSYRVGSFSAGETLTIDNSALSGDQTTLTAPVALIGDSLIDSGSGALTLAGAQWTINNNTMLVAASVAFDGAQTIAMQNTAIVADSVEATASHDLDVVQSEFQGQTLLLRTTNAAGGGILVDQSTLFFGSAITIDSASTVTIQTSLVGDFPAQAAAKAAGATAIDVRANGTLVVSGSHVAGDDVVLDGAGQTLSGIIDGNHVTLTSSGGITAGAAGLSINAGALDVAAQSIDLLQSAIHVGTGLADNGHDATMLELLAGVAPGLLPASSAPNAAFIAEDGVLLGTLTVEGGYLFVRAPFLAAASIEAPGDLFYNYRPFADDDAIAVGPGEVFDIGGTLTLAFGGTGYEGDVDVVVDGLQPKATASANYVFLTEGELRALDRISTSGQVVVLGGSVIRPPQQNEPDNEAENAIVLTEDLGEELIDENTGDEVPDPDYGDGAQVDIVSGGTDELNCQ